MALDNYREIEPVDHPLISYSACLKIRIIGTEILRPLRYSLG